MTYWLDLFTGTTWRQFVEAGGTISGFRRRRRKLAERLRPGNILLCYLKDGRAAVKIVDDRGIDSLKIIELP